MTQKFDLDKSKKGFTLLEIVIAVGIISFIIPAMFSIFFATIRAQSKVLVVQEVKRNGDDALAVIESLIKRNAVTIHNGDPPSTSNEICDSSAPTPTPSLGTLYFKDNDGTWFSFVTDDDKIASNSGSSSGTTTYYLTSDKVQITDLDIECNYVGPFTPPVVSIYFTVSQSGPTGRVEETATLNYQTKVKLRAY